MKTYTDLEQSKKLETFLPIESADMCWTNHYYGHIRSSMTAASKTIEEYKELLRGVADSMNADVFYPCWSLAALLEEIPSTILNDVNEDLKLHIIKDDYQYYLFYENEYTGNMFEIETEWYENMIDACVEMIIKLHEQKLL